MKNTRKNAGNAFVIVLILIALLAALTVTLTRMGSTTQDVSEEQARVIASQVMRQGRSMANAVDGLIAKGCSITQLSFENPVTTGYTNVQSPSDKSCWLFDGAGAGMSFPKPPPASNDNSNWVMVRNISVTGVGIERETGTICPDNCQELLLILPVVNANVCKAINLSAGVTTSFSTTPPAATNSFGLNTKFNASSTNPSLGNFSSLSTSTGSRLSDGVGGLLYDKKTACFEAAAGFTDEASAVQVGTGKYMFYQVLYER